MVVSQRGGGDFVFFFFAFIRMYIGNFEEQPVL